MGKRVRNRLPSDEKLAVAAAQAIARKALANLSGKYVPENRIDADEAPDEVTRVGFSTDNLDFAVEPIECPGLLACPERSDFCTGGCELSTAGDKYL